jgi:hypothetical protein
MLNSFVSFLKGIGIGSALTVASVAVLLWLSSLVRCCGGQWTYENIWFAALLLIGVLQVLWMLPTILHFRKKNQKTTAQGVLVVSIIVFLLDAAVWFSAMHGGRFYF